MKNSEQRKHASHGKIGKKPGKHIISHNTPPACQALGSINGAWFCNIEQPEKRK